MVFIIRRSTGVGYDNGGEIPVVGITHGCLNRKVCRTTSKVNVGDTVHTKHRVQLSVKKRTDTTLLDNRLTIL